MGHGCGGEKGGGGKLLTSREEEAGWRPLLNLDQRFTG